MHAMSSSRSIEESWEEIASLDLASGPALDVSGSTNTHGAFFIDPEGHRSLGGVDALTECGLGKTVPLHISKKRFWAVP